MILKLIAFIFSPIANFLSILMESDQVLVKEHKGMKIYARKETPQMQRLSNYIKENLVYADGIRPDQPFMCLMPDCNSVQLTVEIGGKKLFGFSEYVKMGNDFQKTVENHLDKNWNKITSRCWFKSMGIC